MPWRLIEFIVVFAVFLVFIGFNLGNRCDINFGFRVFNDVPVFLTAFSSFIFGMLCAVPFIIAARAKRKNKSGPEAAGAKPKKNGEKKAGELPPGPEENSFSDGGPYGIN
jgi:uncharacterized integral membrane protein